MRYQLPAIDEASHYANRRPRALAAAYAFMALLLVLVYANVLPLPTLTMTITIVLFAALGALTTWALHKLGFDSILFRLSNLLETEVFLVGLTVAMAQTPDGLPLLWAFYLLLCVLFSLFIGPSRTGLVIVLAPAAGLFLWQLVHGQMDSMEIAYTVSGLLLAGGVFLFFGSTRQGQLDLAERQLESERELAIAHMKLESQEKLRSLEESWLTILTNMTSALLLVNTNLQVVDIRGAHDAKLGIEQLVKGNFLDQLRYSFEEALYSEQPVALFGRPLLNGAGHVDLRIVALPLGKRNERFAVLIQDATARVEMEAVNRKLAQQMVVADKLNSVGLLAAGIAHEVNNPLAYVMGNVEFLLTKPSLAENERDSLLDIEEGLRHISSIMGDLKGFSFSSSSSYRQTVDLTEIVQRACRLVRTEVRQHAVFEELIPDEPVFVRCQPDRIQQVIVNLLVNAAQAFGHQSPAESLVTMELRASDGKAHVLVSDNGLGMSEEVQGKVFDLFYTTKAAGSGTGLGLSIAYNIADEHDGDLSVTSQIGQGTCFDFWLPLSLAPDSQAPVLIVDDETRALQLYSRALGNFHVTTASSVAEALAVMGQSFEAILCDIRLSDGSGFDLYEQAPPSLQDRFLFFTALPPNTPELRDKPPKARMLHKPVNLKTLEEELHGITQRKAV